MVSAKLPQARLQHILEQIDGILAATRGLDFAQVNNNFIYERAVERAVQIISEAAKELPLELRNKYPDAPWGRSLASETCSGTNITASTRATCGRSRRSICPPCGRS